MDSSYHHGALRETLLTDARSILAEHGADAVTLRELARRAGVSHAAPRRHFADRDALLETLVAQGFDELTEALRAAERAGDVPDRLAAYARTFVRFAVANGALMALMFGSKGSNESGPASESAGRFFALGASLLGEPTEGEPGSLPYLVAATLEGISALVVAGRLPPSRVDEIVDDAVAMLLTRMRAH